MNRGGQWGQENLSAWGQAPVQQRPARSWRGWHPLATAPSLGLGFSQKGPTSDSAQTGMFLHSAACKVAREQEKAMGKTAAALQCTGTQGDIVPLEQIGFKTCQPQRCLGQFSSSALTGNKFEALRCHFCTSCLELFPSFTMADLFLS